MTAAVGPAVRPRPIRREPPVPNGVVGMVVFIFTEVMLFAGLISAHMIAKTNATVWPPVGQPRLPVGETAFNTVLLLASGVVLWRAGSRFSEGPEGRRRALPLLATATLLGLFFVGFQGVEWVALIGEGLTLTSSSHGAYFYLLVGTHALHAAIALGALIFTVVRLRQARLDPVVFTTTRIFWYFVVSVWPLLYWQVYW